jgi:hypothetical protein
MSGSGRSHGHRFSFGNTETIEQETDMTALILINTIAAVIVVGGLYAVTRLGYLAGGGKLDRTPLRFEIHRGSGERAATQQRRAA